MSKYESYAQLRVAQVYSFTAMRLAFLPSVIWNCGFSCWKNPFTDFFWVRFFSSPQAGKLTLRYHYLWTEYFNLWRNLFAYLRAELDAHEGRSFVCNPGGISARIAAGYPRLESLKGEVGQFTGIAMRHWSLSEGCSLIVGSHRRVQTKLQKLASGRLYDRLASLGIMGAELWVPSVR